MHGEKNLEDQRTRKETKLNQISFWITSRQLQQKLQWKVFIAAAYSDPFPRLNTWLFMSRKGGANGMWPAFGFQYQRNSFLNSKQFVASMLDSPTENEKAWVANLLEQKA